MTREEALEAAHDLLARLDELTMDLQLGGGGREFVRRKAAQIHDTVRQVRERIEEAMG